MLNPVSISCFGSDQGGDNPSIALSALDTAVASAVSTAQAVTNILLNQITIVPLGLIFDGTYYIATATVLYSISN